MMTPDPQSTFTEAPAKASTRFLKLVLVAGVVLGAGILFRSWMGGISYSRNAESAGLGIGQPAPRIVAEGWINGPFPSHEELAGEVYVIEAWAFWCGPCKLEAPHLIETYEKFRDRGVRFVGLTVEGADQLDKSRKFLEETKTPWPNGYGANDTLHLLKASAIPAMWVVGRDGKIFWNRASSKSLDQALEEALAAPRPH